MYIEKGEAVRLFDEAVFLTAVGLREKCDRFAAHGREYPYSPRFSRGFRMYCRLLADCGGEDAAGRLARMNESAYIEQICTRPPLEWIEGWDPGFRRAAREGSAYAGCGNLAWYDGGFFSEADATRDIVATAEEGCVTDAYRERRLYEFLCAPTSGERDADARARQMRYVFGRRLVARHPLLDETAYRELAAGFYDFSGDSLDRGEYDLIDVEWVKRLLEIAYEPVLRPAKVCPRCGWTMEAHGLQTTCSSDSCRISIEGYDALEDVPEGSMRLTRGAMHFISDPARLELRIFECARRLGLEFEMWPKLDTCDALIVLADGTSVAVDAKAYGSAWRLAQAVEADHANTRMKADEFVYVVPDDFPARNRGALRLLDRALAEKPGYGWATAGAFEKRLAEGAKEVRHG
jgi:ribosomal protein S27AE